MKESTQRTLKQKIKEIKYRYRNYMKSKILELMTNSIIYENIDEVDTQKMDYILRVVNYKAVVGYNVHNDIVLLGYIINKNDKDHNIYLTNERLYNEKDIYFLIPKNERLKKYTEKRTKRDDGNMVVLDNKRFNQTTDLEIIDMYIDIASEIYASRFSIIVQSKISTIIRGELNDAGLDQLIEEIYNGTPYLRTSKIFDVEDDIIELNLTQGSEYLSNYKLELINILSELYTEIGITSSTLSKMSGVTPQELVIDMSYLTTVQKSYLDSRMNQIKLLAPNAKAKFVIREYDEFTHNMYVNNSNAQPAINETEE